VSRAKNYSPARLMQARAELGTGQIMVQRVDIGAVENCVMVTGMRGERIDFSLQGQGAV